MHTCVSIQDGADIFDNSPSFFFPSDDDEDVNFNIFHNLTQLTAEGRRAYFWLSCFDVYPFMVRTYIIMHKYTHMCMCVYICMHMCAGVCYLLHVSICI